MAESQHGEPARTRLRRAAAEYAGWIAAAAGAALCALGWYGVSGERFAERQLPFLASSTIPGAALIVAGAVLLAARNGDGGGDGGGGADAVTAARVEELHRLLVTAEGPEAAVAGAAVPADTRRVAVPGGSVHHRPDCPLVEGKAEAREVDGAAIGERGLTPCPVCEGPAGGQADDPKQDPAHGPAHGSAHGPSGGDAR